MQLPVGGTGIIKTNLGSQKRGLTFDLLNGRSIVFFRASYSTLDRGLTRAGVPRLRPGSTRSGQPSAVSTSGSVAAGSRPGLSVVQVHYQAFEVQQTEAISLRVAYVSHLSLIPVRI